jgi:hypothetical protein
MAVLSSADRLAVEVETNRTPDAVQGLGITRAQLRAAIDAIDDWVDGNAVAFNNAIPQPARGALSARQKAALLMLVVRRRFEVA